MHAKMIVSHIASVATVIHETMCYCVTYHMRKWTRLIEPQC